MSRFLTNLDSITPFLAKLEDKYPQYKTFIYSQIKNHLIKKESTFLTKEEGYATQFLFNKKYPDQSIFDNYYKLNLNDYCFKKYCHILDILSSLEPSQTKNISVTKLIEIDHTEKNRLAEEVRLNQVRKLEAIETERRRTQEIKEARLHIDYTKQIIELPVSDEVDFKLIATLGDYKLVELISLEAFKNEGRRMNHCVGRFVKPSVHHKIYSLRTLSTDISVLTIKTNGKNKLYEATREQNKTPDPALLKLVTDYLNLTVNNSKQFHEYDIGPFQGMFLSLFITFILLSSMRLMSMFVITPIANAIKPLLANLF